MESLISPWERLGRTVREESDRTAETATTLAAARARWLGEPPIRRSGTRRAVLVGLAAVLCTVVALSLVARNDSLRRPEARAPLAFTVGTSTRPGVVGEWMSAGTEALGVRFADGSGVTLAPRSRGRIAAATADGAEVVLERGELVAKVVHGTARTHWVVRGGPFSAKVTGTRFSLAWDPVTERLDVALTEGSVIVSGPHLPTGRAMVAGERLFVEVESARMLLWRVHQDTPAGDSSTRPRGEASTAWRGIATSAEPNVPASRAPEARASNSTSPVARGSWRQALERGDSRGLFAELDRVGTSQVIASASAAELWKLADMARLGRHAEVATAALLALRARHGVRGATAFLLGKIAADQERSPANAVRWFATYLDEAPNGPLAEEALGRLLTLQRRSNPAAAQAASAEYLARYPNGAYSALARSLQSP